MSFLKHKHKWVKIFSSRYGIVEKCLDCPEYQTTMFDYSTNKHCAIPGNFLCALNNMNQQGVFILCGSLNEFQDAQRTLKNANPSLSLARIHRLTNLDKLRGLRYPTIYLYGTWFENELCQEPELTSILNGWL
jgi:hypothetical protein